MKNIKLDSILLFALVIPFIMTYRISPGVTPFWLFGIIFLGLLIYIALDIIKIKDNLYFRLKHSILWLIIVIVIGSAFIAAIIVRHKTAPSYMIHDIILQQEAAIRFFLDGKNPYGVTYFGTPLEQWNYSATEINPALYHFVMQPFYLLFALPFYAISNSMFGFFDGRMSLLFLFFMLLVFADILTKDKDKKLLFLTILTFNPSILGYTLEGRSDIFMFAFLFIGLFFLHKKKYLLSGIPIGLAFAVKQSAWPIFPFLIAFLFFKKENMVKFLVHITTFLAVFVAITLPFLLWNQKAFLGSTILYLSGATFYSYPISGYGLGMLLNQLGVIKDLHQYYPFILWQAIIGIPLIAGLIFYLKKSPSVARLILVYGIFLFISWYLSRYFNNSHLGYLSLVFITAYFWPKDNN